MGEYLGQGGRLEGGPAPELVRAGYAAETGHGPRLAHGLSVSDIAHAVVLVEGGALGGDDARGLLSGLLALHEIPGDEFPWRPELGDAFNSREALLRERVGASAAGWLSAGRPRREAFRVGLRLVARAGALDLHDALADLAEAVAALAARHPDDLAADYTYLQPAQPSTVGHLLLAYAYPALRDAERVRGAAERLDLSVAGVGGSAGSRWPIDRERLAELLGCTGLVVHAKDAAWAADAYLELVGAAATAATHHSQLGQDLEILASQEFGAVQLADRHSRESALIHSLHGASGGGARHRPALRRAPRHVRVPCLVTSLRRRARSGCARICGRPARARARRRRRASPGPTGARRPPPATRPAPRSPGAPGGRRGRPS